MVTIVRGYVLKKNKQALHLRAKRTFVDVGGNERKAGEEWLVTHQDRGNMNFL